MKEKNSIHVLTILSVILTISAFILAQVNKKSINTLSYLDNLMYTPAMFSWLLLLLLSQNIFSNFSRRIFIGGGMFLVFGHFSNILVPIINGGGFPVYGYSLEEFHLLDTKLYHFIADRNTTLYMLGDINIFSGYSAGDFIIYSGLVLVSVSLLPFFLKRLFVVE